MWLSRRWASMEVEFVSIDSWLQVPNLGLGAFVSLLDMIVFQLLHKGIQNSRFHSLKRELGRVYGAESGARARKPTMVRV